MNNSYQTIIEIGDTAPDWDDFLSGLECAHHEQSTYWANVKRHQGWKAVRLKVIRNSDWLAGAQMLCKRLPFGGSIGYIPSGPFYKVPNDPALDMLVNSINAVAKERKIQYVAITPYVENDFLDKIFEKYGYRPTREKLPPTTTVQATLILDLSKGLDTLLAEMRGEMRRKIRHALKSGLQVREGDKSDLDTLFRLMAIVTERRGESPTPNRAEVFHHVWDCFNSKGYVKLLVAESEGDPVSIAILFTFGQTVRFWKFGWSGAEEKKYPNHLLYWEMIKWSKENGFRYFDFVQVDSTVTDHLLQGLPVTDELKSRRLYGSTYYKLGFGGKVLKFSGPWFRFQNPLIRTFYNHFGPSVIESPYMRKIISRIA